MELNFALNGAEVSTNITAYDTLMSVLRETFGVISVKNSCSEGECGSCTVLVNDKPVVACIYPAINVDGAKVLTVDGLADFDRISPLQQSFIDHGAVQCGFCTPGLLCVLTGLLDQEPDADRRRILEVMSGNLCRCTGYSQITEAATSVLTPSDRFGS